MWDYEQTDGIKSSNIVSQSKNERCIYPPISAKVFMRQPEEIISLQLQDWLYQISQKNDASFRSLHNATYAAMFANVIRIVHRRELAEEILQEGYMAIWINASSYKSNISTPMAWIATVMRNKGYDLHRRNKRSIQVTDINFNDSASTILGDVATESRDVFQMLSDTQSLALGISALNELQRKVISLTYYTDLSHKEVAFRLERSVGTIKTCIRRGLLKIRARLESPMH